MSKVVVQVPMSKSLRDSATKTAEDYGFSSLQEIFRIFATKLAKREIDVVIRLSSRSERRYVKMDEDFKKGKNVSSFKNVDELMNDLSA